MQQSHNETTPTQFDPDPGTWPDDALRTMLLKFQSLQLRSEGYDGHNRQPQQTPIRVLRWRRQRRRWNARCRWFAINPPRQVAA